MSLSLSDVHWTEPYWPSVNINIRHFGNPVVHGCEMQREEEELYQRRHDRRETDVDETGIAIRL